MNCDPETIRRSVIRERETEAVIRRSDVHELVELIHQLQDAIELRDAEIEHLSRAKDLPHD